MAELLIRTSDKGDRESGDVISVFPDLLIEHTHAQEACHKNKGTRNEQGCLEKGGLQEDYYIETHEFKFERIGSTAKRTNLWTGQVDTFSKTPTKIDGKMQHMDVEGYVKRRLLHAKNKIFGSVANAVWYGGKTKKDATTSTALWNKIEAKTALKKASHKKWPFTPREREGFLAIPVDDFDDKEIERMTEPLYDVDPRTGDFILDDNDERIVLKFRRAKFDWKSKLAALGVSEADVLDGTKSIDLSDKTPLVRSEFKEIKLNKAGL